MHLVIVFSNDKVPPAAKQRLKMEKDSFTCSRWATGRLPIFYMNSHKHVPAQQDVVKLFKAVKPGLPASYVIASRSVYKKRYFASHETTAIP